MGVYLYDSLNHNKNAQKLCTARLHVHTYITQSLFSLPLNLPCILPLTSPSVPTSFPFPVSLPYLVCGENDAEGKQQIFPDAFFGEAPLHYEQMYQLYIHA